MHTKKTPEPENEQLVYLSGELICRSKALLPAFDRGFLYGDGFFETTRINNGKAMALGRHLNRLLRSCAAAEWPRKPCKQEIHNAVSKLVDKNRVELGYLRITVSRGLHEGSLAAEGKSTPTVLIEARPMDLPPLNCNPPFKLFRSPYRKNECSPTAGLKSLSYQGNLLALAEARSRGADEVYFLNTAGYLAEGAITNLFWIRDGQLFTPAIECGILPGITREIILEIASYNELTCNVGSYTESELSGAHEVFCTNSLRGILPVRNVTTDTGETAWNDWPVTRRLAELYNKYAENGENNRGGDSEDY